MKDFERTGGPAEPAGNSPESRGGDRLQDPPPDPYGTLVLSVPSRTRSHSVGLNCTRSMRPILTDSRSGEWRCGAMRPCELAPPLGPTDVVASRRRGVEASVPGSARPVRYASRCDPRAHPGRLDRQRARGIAAAQAHIRVRVGPELGRARHRRAREWRRGRPERAAFGATGGRRRPNGGLARDSRGPRLSARCSGRRGGRCGSERRRPRRRAAPPGPDRSLLSVLECASAAGGDGRRRRC